MRLLSTIFTLSLLLSAAQAPPASQPSSAHEQHQQSYVVLSKKVYAVPEASVTDRRTVNSLPPSEVEGVTSQLHSLIVDDIEDTLAEQNLNVQDISKNIQDILGETSINQWDSNTTNTPFAKFIAVNGTQTLVAAYGILRGGGALPNTRNYLEFYAPKSSAWQLKASVDLKDFDARTFFIAPIEAEQTGQAWMLLWGREFGDTGGRLLVRLYDFDGTEVHTLWQKDDLIRGSVTVSGRSVTLEYDKGYKSALRVRETLHVSPDGLE